MTSLLWLPVILNGRRESSCASRLPRDSQAVRLTSLLCLSVGVIMEVMHVRSWPWRASIIVVVAFLHECIEGEKTALRTATSPLGATILLLKLLFSPWRRQATTKHCRPDCDLFYSTKQSMSDWQYDWWEVHWQLVKSATKFMPLTLPYSAIMPKLVNLAILRQAIPISVSSITPTGVPVAILIVNDLHDAHIMSDILRRSGWICLNSTLRSCLLLRREKAGRRVKHSLQTRERLVWDILSETVVVSAFLVHSLYVGERMLRFYRLKCRICFNLIICWVWRKVSYLGLG